MRLLTEQEATRVAEFSTLGLPVALLELTATGRSKGIMDATQLVRQFLSDASLHDYQQQPQGRQHKRLIRVNLLRPDGSVQEATTSMYRPDSKAGDPRIWVYGLAAHAFPNDVICLCVIAGVLWVVNLSTTDLNRVVNTAGPLADAIAPAFVAKVNIVDQLTEALAQLFRQGFIAAPGSGDTMVGRVLESALGIRANSRKAPDYHGIELKAYRMRAGSAGGHSMKRRNLFAKTPDWGVSSLKSSRQVLDKFGYDRDGSRRLYCEVRSTRPNTQGLQLSVDERAGLVRETSIRVEQPDVVAWPIEGLQTALANKHAETFWIGAESRRIDGVEHFRYSHVEHTQKPLVEQFAPLVAAGAISVDHLIKAKGLGANEKGPLFKIDNVSSELLFPAPRSFILNKAIERLV